MKEKMDIIQALEVISMSGATNKLVSFVYSDVRHCMKHVTKRHRPLIELIAMSRFPHLVARQALRELRAGDEQ